MSQKSSELSDAEYARQLQQELDETESDEAPAYKARPSRSRTASYKDQELILPEEIDSDPERKVKAASKRKASTVKAKRPAKKDSDSEADEFEEPKPKKKTATKKAVKAAKAPSPAADEEGDYDDDEVDNDEAEDDTPEIIPPTPAADPAEMKALAKTNPTPPYHCTAIKEINDAHPLSLVRTIDSNSPNWRIVLSDDGKIMAVPNLLGSVRLYDTTSYIQIQELRDRDETQAEEFRICVFTKDARYLYAAGKLKKRDAWEPDADDLEIAGGPIKCFDVVSGDVVTVLSMQSEEITDLQLITFKGDEYLVSCGQDGYIWKHKLMKTGVVGDSTRFVEDAMCNAVLSIAFVPQTGNKYFLAATEGVECQPMFKLYDFDARTILQQFPVPYSGFADCIQFFEPTIRLAGPAPPGDSFLFVTRGQELSENVGKVSKPKPNAIHVHRLTLPSAKGDEFIESIVCKIQHEKLKCNESPQHLVCNGRYIIAPTTMGDVFIFNIKGDLVGILHDHARSTTVRDAVFHPTMQQLLTTGDDCTVKIYETVQQ